MNPTCDPEELREQIQRVLNEIQDCIREGRFTVPINAKRQENCEFIQQYRLTFNKIRELLLKIAVTDFCEIRQNKNLGFEHEVLYIFCPYFSLCNATGEKETVEVYTKFNLINYGEGKRTIVISFHKRNHPIDYPLR